jgi:predicted ATPase
VTNIPLPLISKLRIENFKSIKSAQLEFSPLTVLVGANSAGKSSVLQAIFLLSQIVRGHSQSGLVNLNGAELQLGIFSDIKHSLGRSRSGTIQFEIEVNIDDPRRAPNETRTAEPTRATARTRQLAGRGHDPAVDESKYAHERLSWVLSLGAPEKTQVGLAKLTSVELAADRIEGEIRAIFTPPKNRRRLDQENSSRLVQLRPGSAFTRSIDSGRFFDGRLSGPFQLDQEGDSEIEAGDRHFLGLLENALPQRIYIEQPDTAALSGTWLNGLASQLRRELQVDVDPKLGDWDNAFEILRIYVKKTGNAQLAQETILDRHPLGRWVETQKKNFDQGKLSAERIRLLESLRGWGWRSVPMPRDDDPETQRTTNVLPIDAANVLFPFFAEWVDGYDDGKMPRPAVDLETSEDLEGSEDLLLELSKTTPAAALYRDGIASALSDLLELQREPHIQLEPQQTAFDDVVRDLRERMSTSVSYLGPLREDPSPAYRPGEGGAIARLGVKGEYAVPELERYQSTFVFTVLPPGVDDHDWPTDHFRDRDSRPASRRLVRKTLAEAVDIWMNYLGVASAIDVHGGGRAGIELDIIDRQTGAKRNLTNVGVGVSQLLPVVILCLRARPGDVVLIEQPELHLHPGPQQALADFLLAMSISGRQLIVETHSEYLINRLRLRIARDDADAVAKLVEIVYAEREEGKTTFRSIQPNSYGSFDEWPAGFFDQAPKETEAILRAAMAKRKRQRERMQGESDS